MATVTDYYNIDQTHEIKMTSTNEVTTNDGVKIPLKIFQDFGAGAVYLAFYVPRVDITCSDRQGKRIPCMDRPTRAARACDWTCAKRSAERACYGEAGGS